MSDGGFLSNIPEGFEARMQQRAQANGPSRLTTAELNKIVEILPLLLGSTLETFANDSAGRFRGQEVMGVPEARLGQYGKQAGESATAVVGAALKKWPLPSTHKELAASLREDTLSKAFDGALKEHRVPDPQRSLLVGEFTDALLKQANAIAEVDTPKKGGRR